jgi:CDP-glucose 4,6-dehydratase
VLGFEETVRMTAEWYRAYYDQSVSINDLTCQQILEYNFIAKKKGVAWAQ